MNKNRTRNTLLFLLLSLLPLLVAPAALAISEDELLTADEAYRFSADEKKPGVIDLDWEVADGYYVYRDKFKFETEDGLRLKAQPKLPKGKATPASEPPAPKPNVPASGVQPAPEPTGAR